MTSHRCGDIFPALSITLTTKDRVIRGGDGDGQSHAARSSIGRYSAGPVVDSELQPGPGPNFSRHNSRHSKRPCRGDCSREKAQGYKRAERTFDCQPCLDAVLGFKVQTNITSAEYGQSGGANTGVALECGASRLYRSSTCPLSLKIPLTT